MTIQCGLLSPALFQKVIDEFPRVVLSGVVGSGKTLLLENVETGDRKVVHTDSFSHVEWSEKWPKIRAALEGHTSFVLAGVLAPHLLHKGLEVDAVCWLNGTRQRGLTTRQIGIGKGSRTLMHRWRHKHPEIPVYFSEKALHDDELARMPE